MSWANLILAQAQDALNETVATTTNVTAAPLPATTEGRSVAYVSLILMAIFPIILGAKKSVRSLKAQKDTQKV
jgi:hypothetical protein